MTVTVSISFLLARSHNLSGPLVDLIIIVILITVMKTIKIMMRSSILLVTIVANVQCEYGDEMLQTAEAKQQNIQVKFATLL